MFPVSILTSGRETKERKERKRKKKEIKGRKVSKESTEKTKKKRKKGRKARKRKEGKARKSRKERKAGNQGRKSMTTSSSTQHNRIFPTRWANPHLLSPRPFSRDPFQTADLQIGPSENLVTVLTSPL